MTLIQLIKPREEALGCLVWSSCIFKGGVSNTVTDLGQQRGQQRGPVTLMSEQECVRRRGRSYKGPEVLCFRKFTVHLEGQ